MPERMGVRVQLSLAFALIAAGMGATFGLVAGRLIEGEFERRIAENLAQVAAAAGSAIDREVAERIDDVDVVADMSRNMDIDAPAALAHAGIIGPNARMAGCSWSLVAGLEGEVIATAGNGPAPGETVGGKPWFAEARTRRVVFDASGEATAGPPSPRVIVARPVFDRGGHSVAVMACELGSTWAKALAERVLPTLPDTMATDLMVTDAHFHPVLLPPGLADARMPGELATLDGGAAGPYEHLDLQWPDGKRYLTVALPRLAAHGASGLDWRVVARRSSDLALQPARLVRDRVFELGATLAVAGALLGILVAYWISLPLRAIADAARRIGAGELGVPIPQLGHFREVAVLSRTLRGMISSLRDTAARLTALNATLEERVRERTAEIAEAHQALVRQEGKLWAVIQTAMDGVMIIDENDCIEIFNAACERIFGWKAEEIIGRSVAALMADDARSLRGGQMVIDGLIDPLPRADPSTGQARTVRGLRRDGTVFPLEMSLSRTDVAGKAVYVAIMRDVTDAMQARDQLFVMATQDALTNVRNRRYFLEGAESEFARARRHSRGFSLLLIDADHFKAINDTFGHAAGDLALKNLAEVCRRNVREVDLVGRLGGEEFAIAMPEAELPVARVVADRLRQQIAENGVQLEQRRLSFTVSIGVVAAEEHDRTLEDMLRRADAALYEAKNAGRNRVAVASGEAGRAGFLL